MKILVIGDPHGYNKYKESVLKQADLILVTGDLGKVDIARKRYFENLKREAKGLEELEDDGKFNKKIHEEIYNSTTEILKKLSRFAPTYSILGNVGMNMIYDSNVRKEEKKYGIKLSSLRQGMRKIKDFYFVRNVIRNVNGLRVGFLEYFEDVCWHKEFNQKDKKRWKKAKKETAKAKKVLKNFGNLDILICHQPPYGVLDKVSSKYNPPKNWIGKHAGSKVILDYIKKKQPRYVFCGHIHEAKGKAKIGKTEVYNVGYNGDYILLGID